MTVIALRLAHACNLKLVDLLRFYSQMIRLDGYKCSVGERAICDDVAQYLLLSEIYLRKHALGSLLSPGAIRYVVPPCKRKERIEHQAMLQLSKHAARFLQALKDGNSHSVIYEAFMLGRHAPEQADAVSAVLVSARAREAGNKSPKNQPRQPAQERIGAYKKLLSQGHGHGDAMREAADALHVSPETIKRALLGTEYARKKGRPRNK